MPQYIEIAVVGLTEDRIKRITKGAFLRSSGIAPRYHFLSITAPTGNRCKLFSSFNTGQVFYWIALDDESLKACHERIQQNNSRNDFSLGLYDELLPHRVVRVDTHQQFIAEIETITKAFFATS